MQRVQTLAGECISPAEKAKQKTGSRTTTESEKKTKKTVQTLAGERTSPAEKAKQKTGSRTIAESERKQQKNFAEGATPWPGNAYALQRRQNETQGSKMLQRGK